MTDTSSAPENEVATLPAKREDGLGAFLVEQGKLSAEQLLSAIHYAQDHHLDLRQALLELNLASLEAINALAPAFPMLPAEASVAPAVAVDGQSNGTVAAAEPAAITVTLSPDRTKLERDIKNELREVAATATPSDLLSQIIERGFECRATDIHFDPQVGRYRVRYRIDSLLHDVLELDAVLSTAVISRIKVVSNLNIVERRHPQDGRMTVVHVERPRDLRVSTLPTALGEKIVVRIHEALTEAYGFDQLGLGANQVEQLERLIARPYGAVLVGGPVGAGKTTTLYSCMSRANLPSRNLMSIEDPIEHRMAGVNQVQVDNRINLSFGDGLRAMLRQDPDVLMIGEIRDEETAQIGIRAALTGVLVLSTIHASDAASTLGTLYNYGIPGYLLSASIQGVISQRLVRKVCPYCRIKYAPDPNVLEALDVDPDVRHSVELSRGEGCPACFETGYLGRTGIFEVMEVRDEIRELVLRQTPKEVLRQVAIDLGMQTLKQSAVDKVLEGTTTVEEVYRVVAV